MTIAHTFSSNWRHGVALGLLGLILTVGWYVASPLFISHSVSEALPTARVPLAETAGPRALATGQFWRGGFRSPWSGNDEAPGTGRRFPRLRLEDFSVTNGPDLYIYLSGHPAPRESGQLREHGAFEVGRLKGNVGDQNYELPPELDLNALASAVIYCLRFGVVFSIAQLPHRQEE